MSRSDRIHTEDPDEWRAQGGAVNLPSGNLYLKGDANLDGVVDGADFLIWNTNKFTSVPAWCSGDFTANGVVDGGDFLRWNSNKFTSADSTAFVPEPSCGMFVVLAALGIGFLTQRGRDRMQLATTISAGVA